MSKWVPIIALYRCLLTNNVTKIVNQVSHIYRLLQAKEFSFKCQSFEETITSGNPGDIIYCDPPYIDRHVDYYNGWDSEHEKTLYRVLSNSPSKFILSTWHHNDYRKNEYIDSLWEEFDILTREHFYHVGGSEKNRNPMVEAIITNYDIPIDEYKQPKKPEQLMLLEAQTTYA